MNGVPIDTEGLVEFLEWTEGEKNPRAVEERFLRRIEEMTRQMRQMQGRFSSFPASQRTAALRQAANAVRVEFDTAEAKLRRMQKRHMDPTLPELVEALQADEAKRLDTTVQEIEMEEAKTMIRKVQEITLVRKTDIWKIYERMRREKITPDARTLGIRVYDVFGNDPRYGQFHINPKEGKWRDLLNNL